MTIETLFENINGKKVLVLGDVMVDAYFSGKVDRISPEAPVPIVRVKEREDRLGGAANVALNLKALGAEPIICATVGNDAKGQVFKKLLADLNMSTEGLMTVDDRPTTVKTRIISQHQQMLRVDEESTADLSNEDQQRLLQTLNEIIASHSVEALIFEDYNKGLLTEHVIKSTIPLCREHGILTTVDPKKSNFFSFIDCDLFKPNLLEIEQGLKTEIGEITHANLDRVMDQLHENLPHKSTLLTLSEHGVYHYSQGDSGLIPAHKRDIADVSGAGDTVIATVTLMLLAGASLSNAAAIANLAGGLVCESVGVVPVDRKKLKNEALKLQLS